MENEDGVDTHLIWSYTNSRIAISISKLSTMT